MITVSFVATGIILAVLYIWSICGYRPQNSQPWDAKRFVRTFAPCAIVLLLVLAATAGLKERYLRADFGMFYSSALLLQQDPEHLYDQQVQAEYLRAAAGLADEDFYLPFTYPPVVALLFIPLTMLSFKSAYFAMLAINISLIILALGWLLKKRGYREDQRIALLVSASAALPLHAVLVTGHVTFIAFLLLVMFVDDLMLKREWRTGLWTGLLLFKPILFPIPFLILLWKRQWKAIGVFSLVAVAGLLLSLALVGWNGLQSNVELMRLMANDNFTPGVQSLRSLTYYIGLGTGAWIVLSIATLAALWGALLKTYDERWILTGAMIAVMLIPPYLRFYDLSIGLIAIAIALTTMDHVSDRTRSYLYFLALVPGALTLALKQNGAIVPIMPVVLLFFFVYSLWKASGAKSKSFQ